MFQEVFQCCFMVGSKVFLLHCRESIFQTFLKGLPKVPCSIPLCLALLVNKYISISKFSILDLRLVKRESFLRVLWQWQYAVILREPARMSHNRAIDHLVLLYSIVLCMNLLLHCQTTFTLKTYLPVPGNICWSGYDLIKRWKGRSQKLSNHFCKSG